MNKAKTIVKLDDELEKVADTINQLEKLADDQNTSSSMQTTDPSINKSVDTVTNTPVNTTSNITNQQMDSANQEQTTTASIIAKLQNQLKNTNKIIKSNQAQINKLQQKINMYENRTVSMKNSIVKIAHVVKNLQDQIHAYINPGNIYDLNCQDQELKHYTYTANESAKAINVEHKVDLTTPQGRVSLKDKILQDVEDIKMPEEILTEVVEVSPIEEQVNDNTNEVTVITPSAATLDNNIDKDTDNNTDKDIDNISTNTDSTDDIEIINVDDIKDENKQFLNNEDSDTFKQRICPNCQQSATLCLDKRVASIQKIKCHNCNTKFGVDLNNEQIFKY